MMNVRKLVSLTLAITLSGALSPGPLSASAIVTGASMGLFGGLLIALGHMIVELPYVTMLYKLVNQFKKFLMKMKVKFILNVIVTFFLAYFSYLLIKDSINIFQSGAFSFAELNLTVLNPLEAIGIGIILTGFNAYFLTWWLTVGYPLIEESVKYGVRGLSVMYVSHVWMDYAWLALLASGGNAIKLLGSMPYALLLLIIALMLAVFATKIGLDTIKMVFK
jgi:threonine/homoserine/homoserine lactone efflux protein